MYHAEPAAPVGAPRSLAAYHAVAAAPFICPRNWAIGRAKARRRAESITFGVTLLPYSASIDARAGGPHGAAATDVADIGALNTPV